MSDDPRLLPESLRDDFPILHQNVHEGRPLVFLDSAASAHRPRQVIDAIVECYSHNYANVHRGIHTLSERATDAYEQAREKLRAFLNAEHADEIVFTGGTTAAINTVARAWGDANVSRGDEILLTPMEHHSNLVPWFQLAERTGATIKHVPLTDDGRLDVDRMGEVLTDRTRLCALASVSNTLGTINPVKTIARLAHEAGAVVLVDAAQSAPHMHTDVQDLGVDFLALSGHKMCGPSGVGVLYGRRELLAAMPPFMGGGSMINRVYLDRFTPADPPARFEAGTPPIAGAIALGAAVDYLQSIGVDAIHRHEEALIDYAWERLQEVPGIRLLGPAPKFRAGLVSFVMERPHPHDIAQLLDFDGVAVRAGHHCTQPLHDLLGITASTRASFYLYNRPEEIDALVGSLQKIGDRFKPSGRKRKRKQ
ncbi:putative cysteine desulfurase [Posidoniimonas polymericola]|uniref:Cysteine desulfurase n=1 Tax=Posidoniimonas polymericola TaxID=2528002 RepID=A0A5C5YT43_9BACT|nr:cysteine desulfurase [Posidoniimonas polymericola]TWT78149.1 putative cysteine desulfurase [Posidoniimonas polymericola]